MYKLIGSDGQQYGPFTAAQLQQWLAEGRINAQTPVQAVGSTEWRPLSTTQLVSFSPTSTATNLLDTVQSTGNWVTTLLANPLGIPRELSPEQLESSLKLLASDAGFSRAQRLLFLGCMCLVAGLGSAIIAALGIRTHVLGPVLSTIALVVAYAFLRQTQWLVWIGSKLRETSVFRAHFFPAVLKRPVESPLAQLVGNPPPPPSQLMGFDRLQILQLLAWLMIWITCVVVLIKGAPQAQPPPIQILALLGLASYLCVRVATVMIQLLRVTAAVFGGTIVGAAIVFFESFWMAQKGAGANVYALFVATIGLGAVWSLSLIEYDSFTMCYITLPRGGRGQSHFQTPDLSAFSKFLNPILFTIHAPSSTVLVLRREGNGKYSFHDPTVPISPLQSVYDIFDLTETQTVTWNFSLTQEGKTAKALKAATLPIQYGCYPRTPTPEEMKLILDEGAVTRFAEVFFHGTGLATTASQWVNRAAQDWFSSDPLYQNLAEIKNDAERLKSIARTLYYNPNTKNLRLDSLSLEDQRAPDDDTLSPHGAKSWDRLMRANSKAGENLGVVLLNEVAALRRKVKEFPFRDALPSLQRRFEETMEEEFKGYDSSYKLLVSMLSLKITFFDIAELEDREQDFKEIEESLRKKLETVEEHLEQTLVDREKEARVIASAHLPGDMDLKEVQDTLKVLGLTQEDEANKSTPIPKMIIDETGDLGPSVVRIDVKLKMKALRAMRDALERKPKAAIRLTVPGSELAVILTRDDSLVERFNIPLILDAEAVERSGVTEVKVGVRFATIEEMCKAFEETPKESVVFSNPNSEVAIILTRDETIPGDFSIPERIHPDPQSPTSRGTATGTEGDDQGRSF
jgi:hypothetical protein